MKTPIPRHTMHPLLCSLCSHIIGFHFDSTIKPEGKFYCEYCVLEMIEISQQMQVETFPTFKTLADLRAKTYAHEYTYPQHAAVQSYRVWNLFLKTTSLTMNHEENK